MPTRKGDLQKYHFKQIPDHQQLAFYALGELLKQLNIQAIGMEEHCNDQSVCELKRRLLRIVQEALHGFGVFANISFRELKGRALRILKGTQSGCGIFAATSK
ncbi:unnamed protein product [Toxocara canis]|uniref:Four helix bundle protein n=1 Tax=Toxocara canis TaxID=6265 RepID=A0A183UBD1_TOXCA|nr:unnamed protein product [Toxocara canis]